MNTYKDIDFSNPKELLEILTDLNCDYTEVTSLSQNLAEKIQEPHTNKEGRKFHALTQCILECYKILYNFKSTQWISENKLENELLAGQSPICFQRINAKGEVCEYKIINFDQINFDKETEFADEYKIIKKPQKSLEELEQSVENEEYQKVLTLLLNGENVFLTGYAGTGKSYILNKLKEKFKKKLTITSTTGIAAVNVKGQTIHSWAGVGLCKNPVNKTIDKIKTRPSVLKQILNCKILAVDEISMLNTETFEYIDQVLKTIRDSFKPFGGIQVIFIGDFYQLPPVETENAIERSFCFESPLWKDFNLKNVVLKRNYRQSEEKFIKALNDMRINSLNNGDIELLKSRETNLDTFETDILHIFSTNEEANRYNEAKFNMINEPVRIFEAEDGIYRGSKPIYDGFTENENYVLEIFGKNCRAEKQIALKLGARVMLLVNMDFNKGLINGSCGKIIEFKENTITVKFDNGVTSSIPKHKFEYYYHDKIAAERTQYPLRLAYGITIHKSQGMTLDKLVVDCSRIFERGQVYVAMSRVRTIDGLYIKSFSKDKVMVDEKVAKFYLELQEVGDVEPVNRTLFEIEDDTPQVSDDEAKELIKSCVKEFSGKYGKSGICKILAGSRSIENNSFHQKAADSSLYGALKGRRQKAITALIDELIQEGEFAVKHVSFGRPILCVK